MQFAEAWLWSRRLGFEATDVFLAPTKFPCSAAGKQIRDAVLEARIQDEETKLSGDIITAFGEGRKPRCIHCGSLLQQLKCTWCPHCKNYACNECAGCRSDSQEGIRTAATAVAYARAYSWGLTETIRRKLGRSWPDFGCPFRDAF